MTKQASEGRLRPRKTPRQARAVETQARILDAARRVFARHGYAAGTTNRIAQQAGLSVGSLYQYFPNKDSIRTALGRELVAEGTRELRAATRDDSADVSKLVHRAVTAFVEVHARDRRLHRVLFEESPRAASLRGELARVEDAAVALVAARLLALFPALRDVELVSRIVVTTIESLVHRLVASERPLDTSRFVAQTTRLVSATWGTWVEAPGIENGAIDPAGPQRPANARRYESTARTKLPDWANASPCTTNSRARAILCALLPASSAASIAPTTIDLAASVSMR